MANTRTMSVLLLLLVILCEVIIYNETYRTMCLVKDTNVFADTCCKRWCTSCIEADESAPACSEEKSGWCNAGPACCRWALDKNECMSPIDRLKCTNTCNPCFTLEITLQYERDGDVHMGRIRESYGDVPEYVHSRAEHLKQQNLTCFYDPGSPSALSFQVRESLHIIVGVLTPSLFLGLVTIAAVFLVKGPISWEAFYLAVWLNLYLFCSIGMIMQAWQYPFAYMVTVASVYLLITVAPMVKDCLDKLESRSVPRAIPV